MENFCEDVDPRVTKIAVESKVVFKYFVYIRN